MWIDIRTTATVATLEQVEQLNRDGWFVIEHAFDADTMADLADSLTIVLAPDTAPSGAYDAEAVRRFCGHPLLAGLARDFLGPEAHVLDHDAFVRGAHDAHDLGFAHRVPDAGVDAAQMITCWVAVTDTTVDAGCLQVLGGGHRSAGDAGATPRSGADAAPIVDVALRAGSVVVMSSLLPSRTLANHSDRTTAAFAIDYVSEPAIAAVVGHEPGGSRRQFAVVRGGQLVAPS